MPKISRRARFIVAQAPIISQLENQNDCRNRMVFPVEHIILSRDLNDAFRRKPVNVISTYRGHND